MSISKFSVNRWDAKIVGPALQSLEIMGREIESPKGIVGRFYLNTYKIS
jgi:hypothetical protein